MSRLFRMVAIIAFGLWFLAPTPSAQAQETDLVWVQIEAHPSLRTAEDRVRAYATQLPNVAGFQQSATWHVVALGPYEPLIAQETLRSLRAQGIIPRDSFIAQTSAYRSQFWPIGANDLQAASAVPAPTPATPIAQPEPEPEAQVTAPLPDPDETPAQARASERLLSRDEKKELQIALRWAGVYNAAIDGSYGRGTRRAMRDWQELKGMEPTGVLTTKQRAALLRDYNAILDGMDITTVADTQAGIEIDLPLGVVGFDRYDPPFAHYRATGDLDAQVTLISQPGSEARFRGLFNVLQTLELVPTDGPRRLRRNSFSIEGMDDTRHTSIEVTYNRGEMKGYMVVWPAGDDQRRSRVMEKISPSFRTLPGALNPDDLPLDETQSDDLLAGLDVRQPDVVGSGFFIDRAGTILTDASLVAGCDRVTIFDQSEVDVTLSDADLGLAVLRPATATAPLNYARFQAAVPRLRSDVIAAGFSFGGQLGAPTLTRGRIEDLRGLRDEDTVKRLSILSQISDIGGPVMDPGGAVLGMLQKPAMGDQTLPSGVAFALDSDTIKARLSEAGISVTEATSPDTPAHLTELETLATDITVLVACWK